MNRVRVRLFSGVADRLGGREITIALPEGSTGADLLDRLAVDHSDAAELLAACRLAVNCDFADPALALPPNAEIALIPPVSGG